MPEPETGAGRTPEAGAATDKGKQGTEPDAYLKALEATNKRIEGLTSLMGRFGNELGELRKSRSGRRPESNGGFADTGFAAGGGSDDPEAQDRQRLRAELDEDRRERALDRFMRFSGVTAEDMQEIVGRLQANEAVYHRFDRRGQLDYFASYDTVWKDLRLERYDSAREKADQQRKEQERQREEAKRKASPSGVGATGLEGDDQPLDVSKMSSREYLEKVLIPAGLVDKNDPPKTTPAI